MSFFVLVPCFVASRQVHDVKTPSFKRRCFIVYIGCVPAGVALGVLSSLTIILLMKRELVCVTGSRYNIRQSENILPVPAGNRSQVAGSTGKHSTTSL